MLLCAISDFGSQKLARLLSLLDTCTAQCAATHTACGECWLHPASIPSLDPPAAAPASPPATSRVSPPSQSLAAHTSHVQQQQHTASAGLNEQWAQLRRAADGAEADLALLSGDLTRLLRGACTLARAHAKVAEARLAPTDLATAFHGARSRATELRRAVDSKATAWAHCGPRAGAGPRRAARHCVSGVLPGSRTHGGASGRLLSWLLLFYRGLVQCWTATG